MSMSLCVELLKNVKRRLKLANKPLYNNEYVLRMNEMAKKNS